MIARRAVLCGAALLWLGMLGALGYREHVRRSDSQGAQAYAETLFSKDAPVLVSKSVWLREPLGGVEQRIGFLETQLTHMGRNDVNITQNLDINADRIPPMAAGMLRQALAQVGLDAELKDFQGRLDVYVNRRMGLRSIKGRAKYGDRNLMEFWGKPLHGRYLKIVSRVQRETKTNLVPYDPRLPFGTGGSPFRGMKNLGKGRSWTVTFFDPFTRQSVARVIRVVGREELKYKNAAVDCFVLTAHPARADAAPGEAAYGSYTSKAWVSVEKGQLLREEAEMKFLLMSFRLAMVLEDSVTESDYRVKLESPLQKERRRRAIEEKLEERRRKEKPLDRAP